MVDAFRRFTSSQAVLDEAFGRAQAPKSAAGAVELFHYSDSLCSQKVRVALAEKGVPWTSRFVNLSTHENLHPDYVRINPRAVVPTLIVDGVVVIDSATIVRYIDAHFSGPDLTPNSTNGRSTMEEWILIGDAVPLRAITYRELGRMSGAMGSMMQGMLAGRRDLLQRYLNEKPDLAEFYRVKIEDTDNYETQVGDETQYGSAMADMELVLDRLEILLRDNEWIAGPEFSLADVIWMPNIARLKLVKLDSFWEGGRRPNIAGYWSRLKSRPSFSSAIKAYNTPPDAPGSFANGDVGLSEKPRAITPTE